MTDHYDATQLLLEDIERTRQDLHDEYERPEPRHHVIGGLQNTLRNDLRVAEVRATLAVAQGLHDIHGLLDENLSELTTEVSRLSR